MSTGLFGKIFGQRAEDSPLRNRVIPTKSPTIKTANDILEFEYPAESPFRAHDVNPSDNAGELHPNQ